MRFLNEPLVHFLLLGALLFAVGLLRDSESSAPSNDIVVTAGQIEHLAAGFARTWRRAATIALDVEPTARVGLACVGHGRDGVGNGPDGQLG